MGCAVHSRCVPSGSEFLVMLQFDFREIPRVEPPRGKPKIFCIVEQKQRWLQLANLFDHGQPSSADLSEMNQLLNLDVAQNYGKQFVWKVVQKLGLCLRGNLQKNNMLKRVRDKYLTNGRI